MIATKERLAKALEEIAAPREMIAAARAGRFDDFESASATPIGDLVSELWSLGTAGQLLAKRAIDGEFDGTAAESEAWAARSGLMPN